MDWLKTSMVYENSSYVLSENPDTVHLIVHKALMDHRMMLHESDLLGCWETLLPTHSIATGNDALITKWFFYIE
jgi:hypothetical protein